MVKDRCVRIHWRVNSDRFLRDRDSGEVEYYEGHKLETSLLGSSTYSVATLGCSGKLRFRGKKNSPLNRVPRALNKIIAKYKHPVFLKHTGDAIYDRPAKTIDLIELQYRRLFFEPYLQLRAVATRDAVPGNHEADACCGGPGEKGTEKNLQELFQGERQFHNKTAAASYERTSNTLSLYNVRDGGLDSTSKHVEVPPVLLDTKSPDFDPEGLRSYVARVGQVEHAHATPLVFVNNLTEGVAADKNYYVLELRSRTQEIDWDKEAPFIGGILRQIWARDPNANVKFEHKPLSDADTFNFFNDEVEYVYGKRGEPLVVNLHLNSTTMPTSERERSRLQTFFARTLKKVPAKCHFNMFTHHMPTLSPSRQFKDENGTYDVPDGEIKESQHARLARALIDLGCRLGDWSAVGAHIHDISMSLIHEDLETEELKAILPIFLGAFGGGGAWSNKGKLKELLLGTQAMASGYGGTIMTQDARGTHIKIYKISPDEPKPGEEEPEPQLICEVSIDRQGKLIDSDILSNLYLHESVLKNQWFHDVFSLLRCRDLALLHVAAALNSKLECYESTKISELLRKVSYKFGRNKTYTIEDIVEFKKILEQILREMLDPEDKSKRAMFPKVLADVEMLHFCLSRMKDRLRLYPGETWQESVDNIKQELDAKAKDKSTTDYKKLEKEAQIAAAAAESKPALTQKQLDRIDEDSETETESEDVSSDTGGESEEEAVSESEDFEELYSSSEEASDGASRRRSTRRGEELPEQLTLTHSEAAKASLVPRGSSGEGSSSISDGTATFDEAESTTAEAGGSKLRRKRSQLAAAASKADELIYSDRVRASSGHRPDSSKRRSKRYSGDSRGTRPRSMGEFGPERARAELTEYRCNTEATIARIAIIAINDHIKSCPNGVYARHLRSPAEEYEISLCLIIQSMLSHDHSDVIDFLAMAFKASGSVLDILKERIALDISRFNKDCFNDNIPKGLYERRFTIIRNDIEAFPAEYDELKARAMATLEEWQTTVVATGEFHKDTYLRYLDDFNALFNDIVATIPQTALPDETDISSTDGVPLFELQPAQSAYLKLKKSLQEQRNLLFIAKYANSHDLEAEESELVQKRMGSRNKPDGLRKAAILLRMNKILTNPKDADLSRAYGREHLSRTLSKSVMAEFVFQRNAAVFQYLYNQLELSLKRVYDAEQSFQRGLNNGTDHLIYAMRNAASRGTGGWIRAREQANPEDIRFILVTVKTTFRDKPIHEFSASIRELISQGVDGDLFSKFFVVSESVVMVKELYNLNSSLTALADFLNKLAEIDVTTMFDIPGQPDVCRDEEAKARILADLKQRMMEHDFFPSQLMARKQIRLAPQDEPAGHDAMQPASCTTQGEGDAYIQIGAGVKPPSEGASSPHEKVGAELMVSC